MKIPPFISSVFKAGGARAVALASSLIFTAIASKIVFQTYGATAFGIVTFISSIQFLIPFADLGLGAVIMNHVAEANRRQNIQGSFKAIFRSLKIQICFASVIAILVLVAFFFIGPEVDFADAGNIPTISLLISALIILANVPMTFGNRVLIGLNRTHTAIFIQACAPPLVLGAVVTCSMLGLNAAYLYPIWPLSTLIASATIVRIALKRLDLGVLSLASGFLRAQFRSKEDPIWGTALSMLVISTASPLTYNSDRVILGVTAVPQSLATYSIGAQIFSPLISLITSAATPLWSQFGHGRGAGKMLVRATAVFGVIGLGASGLLFLATPIYSWFVTGSPSYVPIEVQGTFAIFLIVNSLTLPSMMRLNSGAGIRFQAAVASLACFVGLPLSIWAAYTLGTSGPALASAVVMASIQLVPMIIWQFRRTKFEGKEEVANDREGASIHASTPSNGPAGRTVGAEPGQDRRVLADQGLVEPGRSRDRAGRQL